MLGLGDLTPDASGGEWNVNLFSQDVANAFNLQQDYSALQTGISQVAAGLPTSWTGIAPTTSPSTITRTTSQVFSFLGTPTGLLIVMGIFTLAVLGHARSSTT